MANRESSYPDFNMRVGFFDLTPNPIPAAPIEDAPTEHPPFTGPAEVGDGLGTCLYSSYDHAKRDSCQDWHPWPPVDPSRIPQPSAAPESAEPRIQEIPLPNDDELVKIALEVFPDDPGFLRTKWKDGIDIQVPTAKYCEISLRLTKTVRDQLREALATISDVVEQRRRALNKVAGLEGTIERLEKQMRWMHVSCTPDNCQTSGEDCTGGAEVDLSRKVVERLSPKASEWTPELPKFEDNYSEAAYFAGITMSQGIEFSLAMSDLLAGRVLPWHNSVNAPTVPPKAAISASGRDISDTAVRQLKEEK